MGDEGTMERLNFTTRVLGHKAADQLKAHQVTQTLRAGSSSIVMAIFNQRVKPGELMQVVLDDKFLGYASLVSMDKVIGQALTLEDAKRGGFDNRFEMLSALKRAGYRFMPLDRYSLYRIRFDWWERSGVRSQVLSPPEHLRQGELKNDRGGSR